MLGIALRSGNPISFWEFTRKGIVIPTISTALCAVYFWLRYFVLLAMPATATGQRVNSATHSL